MNAFDGIATDIISTSTKISQPTAYHGGGSFYSGSSQSAGGKYTGSMSYPGQGIFLDHRALRQNARTTMQDSPQGRATVDRKVDAIAGTGIKLEPTPDITVLGISQDEAADWAKDVSARFHLWASDKKQHRSELMTYYQAQRFYAWSKERDNDVFVRLYYSPDRSLQNPLQFEFIDPDQVRGSAFTSSHVFQHNTDDGIIRDAQSRETGFKIWVKDKTGTLSNGISAYRFKEVTVQKKGPKSGRIFMLHGYRPEYAGQGRGYTKLAPVLQGFENFESFSLAHISQAINQAVMAAWIVPSKDEDTKPIFNSLTNGGVGTFGEDDTDIVDDCETSLIAGDFACQRMPEQTIGQPGIIIQSLTKGADIKFANPNAPGTGYDKFEAAFLSSLSAVSGMPREMVVMKFGNNFSANRATLLLAYRVIEIDRADNNAEMDNPIEEMWLSGEIAAGRVSAPGWSDPRLRSAWLKSTWRGSGVPDIDPGKLAKAVKDRLETASTNVERESQLYSGIGAADNIAINNKIFGDYEILPFTPGFGDDAEPDEEGEED